MRYGREWPRPRDSRVAALEFRMKMKRWKLWSDGAGKEWAILQKRKVRCEGFHSLNAHYDESFKSAKTKKSEPEKYPTKIASYNECSHFGLYGPHFRLLVV